MTKRLKSLIRLGKWTVDEKRRILGELHAREEEVIATIDAMDRQLAAEQAVANEDATGAGFTFGGFYDRHMHRRETLLRQLEALRHEIELARDDLAEAYRSLKTYETAEKQRLAREREEEGRKEQVVLDEIGQTLHRRKAT
jgi:flagellar FliJ protein